MRLLMNTTILEDRETKSGFHKFTWQPHGSQLTIIEEVPMSGYQSELRNQSCLIGRKSCRNLRLMIHG